MNNRKTPIIRFKGFTDDWEQRKFEEVFIERREKTEQENEDTLLSCTINGMFLNSELFGHFRGTTTIGYLRVKKNDLILSAQNLHLGNANVNLRFEHGIISPAYKVYDLNSCDPEFVQAWVKKDNTKNFFLAATTEGASQCRKNIEWETLGKQTISMPSMDEQRQIGVYFRCLDHLITLHQRKLEKLKIVKKAMLENCFPKNGEKVPKFRFSGFTGDWEQRKLGEVTESYSGGTPTAGKKEYYDGDIPFIRSGEISSDKTELFISEEGLNSSSAKMIKTGDILYALYGATSGEVSISKLKGAINQAILAIQPHQNYDGQFLMQWLRKSKENIIGTYLQGGQGNLSGNIVKELAIDVPTYKEQKEIGAYFHNLDHLITLHQRKLEKLKIIKKSFLEKMFV